MTIGILLCNEAATDMGLEVTNSIRRRTQLGLGAEPVNNNMLLNGFTHFVAPLLNAHQYFVARCFVAASLVTSHGSMYGFTFHHQSKTS